MNWANQIGYYDFITKQGINDEIKKKASAWFRVTYDPWIAYVKKSRKKRQEDVHHRYEGLFSFAWIVYPVLFSIYDMNKSDPGYDMKNKKKKKKKKNKQSNDKVVSSGNTNDQ